MIRSGALKSESALKLTGHIDARDLAAIENLPAEIKTLDLSGVSIDGLILSTREYFGRSLFKEGEIPAYTFFRSHLETIVLPGSVSDIGEGAFAASSLKSIVIPEGVTRLDNYAFYGCPGLTSVSLPSSLESIGKGTFGNCIGLKSLSLASTKISEIPERAFAGDLQLESLTLPSGLSKVGREAFSHTKISDLNLTGVNEFEPFALSGMPYLENLAINPQAYIPKGLLMDDTSLASLSGSPNAVPDYFAANCTSLDAQSSMGTAESVGRYAFANNPSELLILPRGLQRLDRGVISGMTLLQKIDATSLENAIPEVDETTFQGISQPDVVLFVTDESFDDWENHPVWGKFKVMSQSFTEVAPVTAQTEEISVRLLGGHIVLDSPEPLDDVRVYTTDGRMIFSGRPAVNHFELSTDAFPKGVVILVAADAAGHTKNASILIN